MSGYVDPEDIRESFGKPRSTCIVEVVVAAHKCIIGWVAGCDDHLACETSAGSTCSRSASFGSLGPQVCQHE